MSPASAANVAPNHSTRIVKSVMVRVDDKPFDWYQNTVETRRLN
ncbi:MAG TPA: hypothetical protein VK138_05610 [Acidiferrobacterales bacterium]|nr:hypothetical protein [Acidiferrobacterales bacterium]